MATTFECPNCHAGLDYETSSQAVTVRCDFCRSTVIVPETLRTPGPGGYGKGIPDTPMLDPMTQGIRLREILEMVRSGRKSEAIRLFQETFHVNAREAQNVIEQLERNEAVRIGTTSVQTFSSGSSFNPVLTDSLGRPIGSQSRAGRTIGCLIGFILIFTALAVVVPLLIGGGAAFWGLGEAGNIMATIESGFSEIATLAPPMNGTAAATPIPATPTPGFATLSQQFGGQEGTGPGFFKDTRQIGVDGQGNIYTGDYQGGRVQVFSPTGQFLATWTADVEYMIGMAVDRQGVVYFPGTRQLLRYDGMTGEALPPFSYNGAVTFRGVAAMPDGAIIATSSTNIVRFNNQGSVTLDLTSPFAVSNPDGTSPTPESVAVDGGGNLYFINTDEILIFDNQGNFRTRFGGRGDAPDQFQGSVTAIAVDGQGRIYVQHFRGISVFDSSGRFIEMFRAPGIAFDMVFNDQNELVRMDRNGNQITIFTIN